jgi:hypothetical protein
MPSYMSLIQHEQYKRDIQAALKAQGHVATLDECDIDIVLAGERHGIGAYNCAAQIISSRQDVLDCEVHKAEAILRATIYDHIQDMAWMFTAEYGFHTQADRDACPDYQHALANLRALIAE